LKTFAPAVFWQDQRNSRVKYTSNGNIDITSCGGTHTIDAPCTDTLANSNSPASLRKSSGVMHIVTPLPTPAATRFSTRPRIELYQRAFRQSERHTGDQPRRLAAAVTTGIHRPDRPHRSDGLTDTTPEIREQFDQMGNTRLNANQTKSYLANLGVPPTLEL